MRNDIDGEMSERARRRHGVFSVEEVHRAGGDRWLIGRRVRSGRWERLSSRVLGIPGSPETLRRNLTAAQLHDPVAVGSHTAAAALHRFILVPRPRPEVTSDYAGKQRSPFAAVHVSIDLTDDDVVEVDGLRVTSIARTAADLLTVRSRPRVERIVDDLLSGGRLTLDELKATHDRYARGGRPTTVAMREIIAARGPGWIAPGSVLEAEALDLIRAAGLPEPDRQYQLPGWGDGPALADLAWPAWRVIVELDGRRWHARDAAHQIDRERDNAVVLAGWSPFRFTAAHVRDRPGYVTTTLRRALASAAA